MIEPTIANDYTIIQITVTTTPTTIHQLILAAGEVIGNGVIQIALTPANDILIQDTRREINMTLSGSKTKYIPVQECLDSLKLSCASGTVAVALELFLMV